MAINNSHSTRYYNLGSFIYYRYKERTILNEKYNELKTIAELKINQIEQ